MLSTVVAVKENGGRPVDLTRRLEQDTRLTPVLIDSDEGLGILRHSAAHVMAEAVQALFPGVKVTIGPSIENGFYYDFDYEQSFTPEDLPRIEARMKKIIKKGARFERTEMKREDAIRLFEERGEPYKVELLKDLDQDDVSVYRQGDFVDLCRGPHIPNARMIRAFKIMSVAGAYWRGDENRQRLQRIYGTAF
ncbi:MAG: threonine--tRNA ligase, partial [Deltaproteobacteria bacterium]|nr:threonine--tRNA ligase [Deltaproteobacteria bacterium]